MRAMPVFLSKHEWDYIQNILAHKKLAGNKYCWHLLKEIDNQLGGNYPNNHTW